MNLPKQSKPVTHRNLGAGQSQITPSQGCGGVPSNLIGACYGNNGPIPGKFNCQACCALRGAISWQGGGYAVAC